MQVYFFQNTKIIKKSKLKQFPPRQIVFNAAYNDRGHRGHAFSI